MYETYGLLRLNGWHAASDGATRTVTSPVTEQPVGAVPAATPADIDATLAAARTGLAQWREVPAWTRARILRRTADLMRERVDDIARLISTETGKPLAESRGETNSAADQFEWYGEEAKRIYGRIIPGRNGDERLSVIHQPVGICLSLSAWNFPALLPARKIAAALAAGCAIIARPASEAPGATLAIGQALIDAGVAPGAIGILTGDAGLISETLIDSPSVRKVSLTGSVPVGKHLLGLAANGVKRVSMELGGHAPVIVHADADPVAAARKVAGAKYRNTGQVCISPSRFYVHRSIQPQFEAAFVEVARSLVVGDGLRDGVTMGPMIRRRAFDSALALIEDARTRGARLLTGGRRPAGANTGHFLEPTVLTDVPDDASIMHEEPFAPVAPIAGFTDLGEVLERANSTPFGLASYVFTNNAELAARTAEGLEAGMVGVNETLLALAEAPFGGVKESGFGREGGSEGIMDYLDTKYVRHRLSIEGAR
ncbi:NAD-dependent succinate-semialdehyde dehydrogenase [Devosia sp.]|uniref:NAD-dependent succinate-semialdehyde dehydrogenase n=1 Tax=Devosia sp. TaxID=1871048 RepID=UPI0035AE19EA